MKNLSEIEFAIDYFRGHTDEDLHCDFSNDFERKILNSHEKDLIARTLEWVTRG